LQRLVRDSGELSRPVMWGAGWRIFREHPVFGAGAGSFNVMFERHRPDHEQTDPRWTHNEYLNTLSDYGAVGGVLFFGACGLIAWRAARRGGAAPASSRTRSDALLDDPIVIEALGVGVLAFAFQLFVDFHLKIPALALTSATIAGLAVNRRWSWPTPDGLRPVTRPGRASAAVAGLIAVFAVAVWIVPRFRAEALREEARREVNRIARAALSSDEKRQIAIRAHDAFSRATRLDRGNAQAWADLAYALAILGHEDRSQEKELGIQAEAAARRALAQSKGVSEFWLRLGVGLDMQQRWLEAGDAVSEGLRLAPKTPQAWFYQAYHFALNPITHPLARAAVATCLRLDPSNPEGEALRRYLAAGQ
jgi:hypothetical protein